MDAREPSEAGDRSLGKAKKALAGQTNLTFLVVLNPSVFFLWVISKNRPSLASWLWVLGFGSLRI